MFKRSLSVLATIATAFVLAACGGGEDGGGTRAIPAGAKVCKLELSSAHPLANYRSFVLVKQIGDRGFFSPILVSEPDDVLRVQYPFAPGIIYEVPGSTYIFTMQEFSYRNPGPTWSCIIAGLALGDRIVWRGGPSDRKIEWYLNVYATITLNDGRLVLSEPETYVIER